MSFHKQQKERILFDFLFFVCFFIFFICYCFVFVIVVVVVVVGFGGFFFGFLFMFFFFCSFVLGFAPGFFFTSIAIFRDSSPVHS